MEQIIAKAVKQVRVSDSDTLTIEASAHQLNGNKHPHFSVTGELCHLDRVDSCGCLHDKARKHWPEIEPIIRLHLSNADDGEPMYAEANGWYWLAGAVTHHFGKVYHGGNAQRQHWKENGEFDGYRMSTPDECLKTLAEHLRITVKTATALRDKLQAMTNDEARKEFRDFIDNERSRWADEAKAGLQLIRQLAT